MKMEELHRPIINSSDCVQKIYSIMYDDFESKSTAKGVKKSVKDNEIAHTDYSRVFDYNLQLSHEQSSTRSYNHDIHNIPE